MTTERSVSASPLGHDHPLSSSSIANVARQAWWCGFARDSLLTLGQLKNWLRSMALEDDYSCRETKSDYQHHHGISWNDGRSPEVQDRPKSNKHIPESATLTGWDDLKSLTMSHLIAEHPLLSAVLVNLSSPK
ncbi:uncharacterized protein CLUP02_00928 [Colletotrichum lupini]|uniref:Uncharacterized protein n=1 Tax=Colletotrichum lupini TaxID=145971 RepID=A0A9Q8SBR3_9PEZI|nr:uncharacterized protein CLUP02_00928 [Colletotrichum lupini]UQC74280.1 hypothetical protein CLUP02_00928 [Colletotrichum lupini]